MLTLKRVLNFFNFTLICANPPLFNLEKMKSIFFYNQRFARHFIVENVQINRYLYQQLNIKNFFQRKLKWTK